MELRHYNKGTSAFPCFIVAASSLLYGPHPLHTYTVCGVYNCTHTPITLLVLMVARNGHHTYAKTGSTTP